MAEIDWLLKKAVEIGASDVHVAVGAQPIYRLHGELQKMEERDEFSDSEARRLLYEILTAQQLEKFEQLNEVDFAYEILDVGRFRTNVFVQTRGIGAVFRVIPQHLVPLEELNLPKAVEEFTRLSRGLVLVTGPTGHGKSTTLASMIDHINRHRKAHILTIEDPVEFIHTNKLSLINQRQIGTHSLSFASALRAAFREDPGNRGKTCRNGLWAWSRHPNYFFEWLHWFTYVLLAVGSHTFLLSLAGPVVMLVFLDRVSGIPWTEAQALRSRGEDYRRYQQEVSAFFPWPPRRG